MAEQAKPPFDPVELHLASLRRARRAIRWYLIVALFIVLWGWEGHNELGPKWIVVTYLSWPFSQLALALVGWIVERFHPEPRTIDPDDFKIPLIALVLLSGAVYWGCLGYFWERVDRWRKSC